MGKKQKEIMLGVPEEEKEEVELKEHRAILSLPEDAVDVTVSAVVYHDGELINVSKKLTMVEIRKAFQKADDGYIDDDDRFIITEKGKAYLEEMEGKIK